MVTSLNGRVSTGSPSNNDLSYLREYEHITLARALLASGSAIEAAELLDRLLEAAERGGRRGSAIEILVLQALAHQRRGDTRAALVPLERALTLAEPEGYSPRVCGRRTADDSADRDSCETWDQGGLRSAHAARLWHWCARAAGPRRA